MHHRRKQSIQAIQFNRKTEAFLQSTHRMQQCTKTMVLERHTQTQTSTSTDFHKNPSALRNTAIGCDPRPASHTKLPRLCQTVFARFSSLRGKKPRSIWSKNRTLGPFSLLGLHFFPVASHFPKGEARAEPCQGLTGRAENSWCGDPVGLPKL